MISDLQAVRKHLFCNASLWFLTAASRSSTSGMAHMGSPCTTSQQGLQYCYISVRACSDSTSPAVVRIPPDLARSIYARGSQHRPSIFRFLTRMLKWKKLVTDRKMSWQDMVNSNTLQGLLMVSCHRLKSISTEGE